MLPVALRRQLGLRPGDDLNIRLEREAIVLRPRRPKAPRFAVVIDEKTGFPVIATEDMVPPLTSEQVEEIIADFP